MEEHSESPKIFKKEEGSPPSVDRYEIQRQLIKEFCKIKEMDNVDQRNAGALEWIEKYADNFDQLDNELLKRYKNAHAEQEKGAVLDEIQKALEILNEKNG